MLSQSFFHILGRIKLLFYNLRDEKHIPFQEELHSQKEKFDSIARSSYLLFPSLSISLSGMFKKEAASLM